MLIDLPINIELVMLKSRIKNYKNKNNKWGRRRGERSAKLQTIISTKPNIMNKTIKITKQKTKDK